MTEPPRDEGRLQRTDVTLEQLAADPHPVLARLRGSAPVAWVPALDGWLVTRYDLAVAVMRDPATFTVDDPRFSTARVVGPSMLSLDGPAHARHRAPFLPPFRPAPVRDRFTPFLEATARDLVDAFPPHGAELRSAFAGPLAVAVVADALGLAGVSAATVLSWYETIVDSVSTVTAGGSPTAAGEAAYARLRANVSTSADDPRSVLAAAATGLTEAEVVSNAAVGKFGLGVPTFSLVTAQDSRIPHHRPTLAGPISIPFVIAHSSYARYTSRGIVPRLPRSRPCSFAHSRTRWRYSCFLALTSAESSDATLYHSAGTSRDFAFAAAGLAGLAGAVALTLCLPRRRAAARYGATALRNASAFAALRSMTYASPSNANGIVSSAG
ncbi:hypothetical protein GCM10027436_07460 [Actinophytocola sediminis]